MKLLIIFIFANALNIILQTLHSICVVKCSKTVAGLVNACAFGFYTYIIILTTADLPLLLKCGIVAILNFICTFAVKWVEEKLRKDKLWKVEGVVRFYSEEDMNRFWVNMKMLPICEKFTTPVRNCCLNVNLYCRTQKETDIAVKFIKENNGKVVFASECAPIIK